MEQDIVALREEIDLGAGEVQGYRTILFRMRNRLNDMLNRR